MTAKAFDAVELMRRLRDDLSREMESMTPGERLGFIRDKAASTALGKKLAQEEDKTAHQGDATGRPSASR